MIQTLPLFRPLNQELVKLLSSLTPEQWNHMTVATQWSVRDIAAHLLDGNIRAISLYRDHHALQATARIDTYAELVVYLNQINHEWVAAMKRVSTSLLVSGLQHTHEDYVKCLEALDPFANAIYPVSWAGDTQSQNWFHIAREYTEKWHHQQQIRDALNLPAILNKQYYRPALETFMMALPHHYRQKSGTEGTTIIIEVLSDAGGVWAIQRRGGRWKISEQTPIRADARIIIPVDLSWKIFTKAVHADAIRSRVTLEGDLSLAEHILTMITVMA